MLLAELVLPCSALAVTLPLGLELTYCCCGFGACGGLARGFLVLADA